MQRLLGASSVFAGWLTLGLGVAAGLVVSELLGLQHKEGPVPPVVVYGISGGVVLWIFVGAALLLAVPMAAAMVASDPRRTLRPIAVGMGLVGLVLLPDPLGVAFGVPLVPGALLVWFGGDLIARDGQFGSAQATTTEPGIGTAPGAVSAGPTMPTAPQTAMSSAAASAPQLEAPAALTTAPNLPAQPAPTARRGSRKKGAGPMRICPWCSTEVPAAAESCPNCKAALTAQEAEQVSIPGVTEVSPELRRYADGAKRGRKPSLLRMMFSDVPIPTAVDAPEPSDADALRPPSSELKAEMARLDAEIASGAIAPGTQDAAAPATPDPATAPAAGPDAPPAAKTRRRAPRT